MKSTISVIDLSTAQEYTYVGLSPMSALVSCAIYRDRKSGSLTDCKTRKQYYNQIKLSKSFKTAAIGDLTVILA
jgi:uncharacterized protein (DUF4213/DUF364 family)